MVPAGALIACLTTVAAPDGAAAEGPWYGYQTLMVDAASLTLGAIALSHAGEIHAGRPGSPSLTFGLIAGVGFLFGPAVVHGLHGGRTETIQKSIALRTLLPLGALAISYGLYAAAWGGCHACVYAIPVVGGASLIVPIAIDAAGAREEAHLPVLFRF